MENATALPGETRAEVVIMEDPCGGPLHPRDDPRNEPLTTMIWVSADSSSPFELQPVLRSWSAPVAAGTGNMSVDHEKRMDSIYSRLTDADGPLEDHLGPCGHRRCVFRRIRAEILHDYDYVRNGHLWMARNLAGDVARIDGFEHYVECTDTPPLQLSAEYIPTWKSMRACGYGDAKCGGTAKCRRERCLFQNAMLIHIPALEQALLLSLTPPNGPYAPKEAAETHEPLPDTLIQYLKREGKDHRDFNTVEKLLDKVMQEGGQDMFKACAGKVGVPCVNPDHCPVPLCTQTRLAFRMRPLIGRLKEYAAPHGQVYHGLIKTADTILSNLFSIGTQRDHLWILQLPHLQEVLKVARFEIDRHVYPISCVHTRSHL